MTVSWIAATMIMTLIGASGVVSNESTTTVGDPAAAMAHVAAKLKSCESVPSNSTTMAQNGCLSDALENADAILVSVKGAILARLSAESAQEPDTAKNNLETARRLEAAQRAWTNYRETECSFYATDMLGGSGEAVADLTCELRETQVRVKRFADWLKDNPPL